MTLPVPVVTIDGASGTGKGVVAHLLATRLGWHVLDSGVLYRLLAFSAVEQGILLDDEAALVSAALALPVEFQNGRVLLKGRDVTDLIRTEKTGGEASVIGTLPLVREALLDRQRAFRRPPGLVTDGRDMGTVVFPDAPIKIFLTASPEERARRRYKQLKEKGIDVNLPDLVVELRIRDRRDQERTVAPLRPASGAICIDTDHMTIEEVVETVFQAVIS